MSWFATCEEALFEGRSLNVSGLTGSGRTDAVYRLDEHLRGNGWHCQAWTRSDVDSMDRRALKDAVEQFRRSPGLNVLLIDDFGDHLVFADGPWLERMLFSAVNELPVDGREFLRCVVVTHPRDREVVGPGSVLRERAVTLPPIAADMSEAELTTFGFESTQEFYWSTGGCRHLLQAGGTDKPSQAGIARARATARLPQWVGQLDGAQQRRLGTVLKRPKPARWRPDDADPFLRPLITTANRDGEECHVPDAIVREELLVLLLSERWPSCDTTTAARRFAARCGNEPYPIWIDNFLSDFEKLDFHRLARFLETVLATRPADSGLRILSRDFVAGRRVAAQELRTKLDEIALTDGARARIEWRLYDQRAGVNLHRRELLLPRRGVGFSLPPALVVVGQAAVGNESDAEVDLLDNSPSLDAWKSATAIL